MRQCQPRYLFAYQATHGYAHAIATYRAKYVGFNLFYNGAYVVTKTHDAAPPVINLSILSGKYNLVKIGNKLLFYLFGMAKIPGGLGSKIEVTPATEQYAIIDIAEIIIPLVK